MYAHSGQSDEAMRAFRIVLHELPSESAPCLRNWAQGLIAKVIEHTRLQTANRSIASAVGCAEDSPRS